MFDIQPDGKFCDAVVVQIRLHQLWINPAAGQIWIVDLGIPPVSDKQHGPAISFSVQRPVSGLSKKVRARRTRIHGQLLHVLPYIRHVLQIPSGGFHANRLSHH